MNDISTTLIHIEWATKAATEATCSPSSTDKAALRIALLKIRELTEDGLKWAEAESGHPLT
jgi:hypothetical protein